MTVAALEIGEMALLVGVFAFAQRIGSWENKPLARCLGIATAGLFVAWCFQWFPAPVGWISAAVVGLVCLRFAVSWVRRPLSRISGHASNFRCVQRRSPSDFAIVCELYLFNTRSIRLNLRRVVANATRLRPRLAFTDCSIADVTLEPGIEQKIELRMTLVLDKDFEPREVDSIDLTKLKIYAVDAFRGRSPIAVSPRAILFLDPENSAE